MNAASFNSTEIFRIADSSLDRLFCVVLINAVQVLITYIYIINIHISDSFLFDDYIGDGSHNLFLFSCEKVKSEDFIRYFGGISLSFNDGTWGFLLL